MPILGSSRRSAARQEYQVQTTGWSSVGSDGLVLPADTAHATIITATMSMYAPLANLPIIVPSPVAFWQDSQGWPSRQLIVNFWLMPPSH
jgi:hypothetical protein